MSLYDNASLVMIPSGVKEDKLYSVKPTDGSGDFTFSRGSDIQATRVNSSGLIEKAKENEILQSNSFSTSPWTAILGASITGGQSGYDGSSDAWSFTKASGQSSRIYQDITLSPVVHTTSIYAKAGTLRYLAILEFSGAFVYFDLQNGTANTTSGNPIDVKIEAVGATGWYRCSIADDSDITQLRIYASDTDGSISGSGSIYIQDAQINYGLIAQDYIETTTTAVVEGLTADLPRLDYSGGASCPSLLLEPSRTNSVEQSEYFALGGGYWGNTRCTIEDNAIVSPEGVQNASKLLQDPSDTKAGLVNASITASGTNTFSFFAKKGTKNFARLSIYSLVETSVFFDLENGEVGTTNLIAASDCFIEDMGNDWYRCGATYSGTTNRFNIYIQDRDGENNLLDATDAYIYIYGAQWEASSSYVSSYIPTYGTAANRGVDDFGSSFSNVQNGGTFFIEVEGTPRGLGSSSPWIQFNFANTGSFVGFGASGNWRCRINDNGTARLVTSPIVREDDAKLCIRYGDFGYEYYANGSSFSTYSTAIDLGNMINNSFAVNEDSGIIRIKQLLTFPTALTDAECIALTTI